MTDVLPAAGRSMADRAVREPIATPAVEHALSARLSPARAGKEDGMRSRGIGVEQILTRPVSLDALEHALRSDFRCG